MSLILLIPRHPSLVHERRLCEDITYGRASALGLECSFTWTQQRLGDHVGKPSGDRVAVVCVGHLGS